MTASSARAAALLAVLWLAGPARGDEAPPAAPEGALGTLDEEVQRHVAQGRAHFNAGRYDEAITELLMAYRLRPSPAYQFSIAQCHRRRGRPREAMAAYQLFLRLAPGSPLRAEAVNYVAELDAVLREQERLEREKRRPVWQRPWFWGVLASSAAAGGVALGVGLGLGLRDKSPEIIFTCKDFPTVPACATATHALRR